ncbi:bifunctional epoxide hydrolase 2-like [Lepus europaeus]|uniref:bifunctional epoxide hydrolase 2-like n=1 Tax=Lepus europaeus TaxID=9983 RepID=UPI002B481C6F|nr:bifunctional epoxide hydrolase 2-like [Lepus europaeus]
MLPAPLSLPQPGVRLYFVEQGSGPAVCLCHGFPESWFSWRYQIPALAQAGYRVLAVDMKGYGESSAPPGGLAVPRGSWVALPSPG